MKTIEVTVTSGFVGCRKTESFEVDDDVSDEEIEEMAQEVMFNMIEWSWHEVKK